MEPNSTPPETQTHRQFAAGFFNETWSLLDKPDRTPEDDARMIHLAHASRLHWETIGTPHNFAVGEWQIARVYCELGHIGEAIYHARLCLDLAERNSMTGFILGSAHEGVARALRLAGDPEAEKHLDAARAVLKELSDPDDAKVLEADLSSIPE